MTRCPEGGNGHPAGGLCACVGDRPLSAVSTGREVGEGLPCLPPACAFPHADRCPAQAGSMKAMSLDIRGVWPL